MFSTAAAAARTAASVPLLEVPLLLLQVPSLHCPRTAAVSCAWQETATQQPCSAAAAAAGP
jgi:hypothetical protein